MKDKIKDEYQEILQKCRKENENLKFRLSHVSGQLAKLIQEEEMSAELRTYLMEMNLSLANFR